MFCYWLPRWPWWSPTLHLCFTFLSVQEEHASLYFSVLYLNFAAGIVCYFVQFAPGSMRLGSMSGSAGKCQRVSILSRWPWQSVLAFSKELVTLRHAPDKRTHTSAAASLQLVMLWWLAGEHLSGWNCCGHSQLLALMNNPKKHIIFSSFNLSWLLI